MFQVLPQILSEVQPKLFEECRKPARHEEISGSEFDKNFDEKRSIKG
jgi:hypothetical protein